MISFLHGADLHLGASFSSFPGFLRETLINYQLRCLEKLVECALVERVDAILFAGDLFDNPKPEDSLVEAVRTILAPLGPASIPFILALGNHDAGLDEGLFTDSPIKILSANRVETLNFGNWKLHGLSFREQWDMRRPLDLFPEKENIFTVGIFHSGLEDKLYMPVSQSQLEGLNYDYYALGHRHNFSKIASRAFYSGNLSQYGGGPGGFLYYSLENSPPLWLASEAYPLEDISLKIPNELDRIKDYRGRAVRLILEGSLTRAEKAQLNSWLGGLDEVFYHDKTLVKTDLSDSPIYMASRRILENDPARVLDFLDPLEMSREEALLYMNNKREFLLGELEDLFRGRND